MPPKLILASGSPRRRELLAAMGLRFEVIRPDIDERQHRDETPAEYVLRLSREKAQTVLNRVLAPAVVLAADTIVVLPGDPPMRLDKPATASEARSMLRRLRARDHHVSTAFTLQTTGAMRISERVMTTVTMRDYSNAEIERYIASGDPFDKAGGYAIQHADFQPVARITGCYNTVVGLPVCALRRALAEIGWPDIHAPAGCDCPVYAPAHH